METWKPEYTVRAQQIWADFLSKHDLSSKRGEIAAIDPQSERVWIGCSGVDVAQQMQAEGVSTPVFLIRVGYDHFVRKGRH